jgi:hypothetical protein
MALRPFVKSFNTVPNPAGMEWGDWRDTVMGFNREIRGVVDQNDDWRSFADHLSRLVSTTPDHEYFESWQSWADALRNAISF